MFLLSLNVGTTMLTINDGLYSKRGFLSRKSPKLWQLGAEGYLNFQMLHISISSGL